MIRRVSLSLPKNQLVGTSRAYAAKAASSRGSGGKTASSPTRGSKPGADAGDSKLEAIKKILLESSPSDEERLATLREVLPPLPAHETITRAWALHQRHAREAHAHSLSRKYAALQSALKLLEETDKGLFEKAVTGGAGGGKVRGDREGLVPRECKVPMDFAGEAAWDGEWKAPEGAGRSE